MRLKKQRMISEKGEHASCRYLLQKKQQVQEGEFPIVEPDFVVPGYIGKNKGIFQVRRTLD